MGKLCEQGFQKTREWFLKDKRLYTIYDIENHEALRPHCNLETVEKHDAHKWSHFDDPDVRWKFVRMLELCFQQLCWAKGVLYEHDLRIFYFKAPADLAEREISCRNLEKQSTQTVFKRFFRKDGSGEVDFCRHHAFERKFYRFDGRWYVAINPTYFFSSDGQRRHPASDVLQSNIKRIERHRSVVSQLLLWADVLANPGDVFDSRYQPLRLGGFRELEITCGIRDGSWLEGTPVEDSETEVENITSSDEYIDEEQLQLWT